MRTPQSGTTSPCSSQHHKHSLVSLLSHGQIFHVPPGTLSARFRGTGIWLRGTEDPHTPTLNTLKDQQETTLTITTYTELLIFGFWQWWSPLRHFQALPVRLKAAVEGNKSLKAYRWLEQWVPGNLQRQRLHGWLLDGWGGSTGAFSTFSACCKFLGTLRIAHCQSHLHVLWETKHLRDLWGKHSWVAKASEGKGCQQTLQNSQQLLHGCSAGEPNSSTTRESPVLLEWQLACDGNSPSCPQHTPQAVNPGRKKGPCFTKSNVKSAKVLHPFLVTVTVRLLPIGTREFLGTGWGKVALDMHKDTARLSRAFECHPVILK